MPKQDLTLKEAFRRCRDAVEKRSVRVYIGDVTDPNTGTFDGAEIGIDWANDLDMSLFVLVHLFGHTVQWHTLPASVRFGRSRKKPVRALQLLCRFLPSKKNSSDLVRPRLPLW